MAAATCTLRLMWANTEVKQVIENVNVDLFVAHVQKMIVDGWPKAITPVASPCELSLIYFGRRLDPGQTLRQQGLQPGTTCTILVGRPPPTPKGKDSSDSCDCCIVM
ncbi:Ubiquitin-like domain-containing protein [Plasmodiophora brassicae]|uniref:Ubiquitin-like domain-containing protein n=1 Tax=Plasmodiophora brassicae TaxID=37360 RepID=A0A0G4J630_PLABS|nr:hypothetical protein PBRA_002678 [Plasmodiophora brassicae]SPQ94835.1 unnamed protein product [Plasmodiophora brassicae]